MATPRSTSRLLRPLAVLALAAASVGVFPGAGDAAPRPTAPQPAAPRTAAEARAQLTALGQEAEKVAEQYNDARVLLGRRQREFTAADRQARAVEVQYAQLSGKVKQIVSAAYKNVPFGQFTTMLTSSSPREFIDQLSTLGLLANRRGALLRRVAAVQAQAVQAQAKAQTALSAAQKTQAVIAAKRADLVRRGQVLKSLLSRLSAQDRAALGGGGTGPRGSRSDPRSFSVGPASGAAKTAVQTAIAQLGKPYAWGHAGSYDFDCSGLTLYAWQAAGVPLPHSSAAQYGVGTHIPRGAVRAGDLVFFYQPTIHHVGIAINNTQMVHAPTYGEPVQVSNIDSFPYVGATRVG